MKSILSFLGLFILLGPVALATDSCLEQATHAELLRELERRLYQGGGGVGDLSLKCQCGNDGGADSYEVWVSGGGDFEAMRAKAKKMCKWGTFKNCEYVRPPYPGPKILECQCGKDGASDTYTVQGAGASLGDAYLDAVGQCRWKPVVKNCEAK